MGEEIQYSRFNKSDYQQFTSHLKEETALVKSWFDNQKFSSASLMAGYELETWLIDKTGNPVAINEAFLEKANNPLLSPELAKFNVELNVDPERLSHNVLSTFEHKLDELWQQCSATASSLGANMLGIGILPTLQDRDLTLKNISLLDRYKALNEQVLRQRKGLEIELNINGKDHLQVSHRDVMLEAAATSLQIHIQAPQETAARYYNASILLSAPMVAVSTNSPCLFGRRLWQETRIPVFEQAVPTGGYGGAASGPVHRVSFGSDYVRDSLYECFQENLDHFPVLLPVHYETAIDRVKYLRLHNGTIWRWNRPLIGFDEDGSPHLRIEHRVVPAGPMVDDSIANAAFYFGCVRALSGMASPPERRLPFSRARHNFYQAARHGLDAELEWLDGTRGGVVALLRQQLLPLAAEALSITVCNRPIPLSRVRAKRRSSSSSVAVMCASCFTSDGYAAPICSTSEAVMPAKNRSF